ncbi:MAG: two-component system response regulator [Deltaproteobacteria bacterium RIFOXYD12_FULL_57_12]|nr:MAG: two-component system response regulator [Deltaproteobacteria bacterium RIFOXYD12_FULL_57_12]
MTKPLYPARPILLVDDEPFILETISLTLRASGLTNVLTCQDSREVLPLLAGQEIEAVLHDLSMPHLPGLELLAEISRGFPEVPVIIITGLNELETAVTCMRQGAFDYLVKPVEASRLVSGVQRALDMKSLRRENALLRERMFSARELGRPEACTAIITNNERMLSIFHYMEAIASSPQPVLITGETGVGKELVARALHTLGNRPGKFVAVNVAGLDDTVFADTLFGHRKGAFTGADQARQGLVDLATAGTLFLDEIGDLSPASQIKLLRLLQEREYLPLGSDTAKRADARILLATNHDLQAGQTAGTFRKDLYYRLMAHQIHIPPLRERLEDLPLLLDHFLAEAAATLGKKKPTPPPELAMLLATHHFPGNIRELQAMVFDAVSSHKAGVLSMTKFREIIGKGNEAAGAIGSIGSGTADQTTGPQGPVIFGDRLPSLKQAEEILIASALRQANGNQRIAAGLLGITRQALNRRLKYAEKK